MAEQKIITKADIQSYWNVPNTVLDDRVNIAILEAQQSDLKRVLGDPFYYAFIEDYNGTTFATPNYQTLFDGSNYVYQGDTIYFSGVEQLLSTYSYIQLAKNNKIHVVRAGVVVKSVEQSETAENFELRSVLRKAYDQSGRLEAEITQYLYEKRSLYPLYLKKVSKDQRKTGFNFYRV
jgi:hypothetical protein